MLLSYPLIFLSLFYCCVWFLLCVYFYYVYNFSSGVLVVVVGGCQLVLIKGAGLRCDLDYTISFWSWILLWKSLHFVEISTFRGYYPHFVEISTFREYYPHFLDIYILRGYYPHLVEMSMFRRYYPHFVDIIRILWILSILITLRAT